MERELKIKTSQRKNIHCIIRGSLDRPVIVLVHGLSGNMNEAMHYNAARYFETHGFSSLRFNLYSWQKGARKLHQCTFATHGKDIDVLLRYLESQGAKQIFVVGHSYGFPSILHAKNMCFRAAAAWDGSVLPTNHVDVARRSQSPKGRIIDEGYFVIIGERMAKDSRKIDTLGLLKKLKRPVSFITVNDNVNGNLSGAQRMFKACNQDKELVVIKGAHHTFSEDGKQEELYAATLSWFRKFL